MTRSRPLIAALLLVGAVACDRDPQAPELVPENDAIATVLADVATTDVRVDPPGGNSLFDRLANQIRGFGGLYRSGVCNVTVVLTDLSEARHAVQLVKEVIEGLVGRACPRGVEVNAVLGEFTYHQLLRFLHASRDLHAIRGVLGTHVDYKLNRLVITVVSRAVAATVIEALPRVGIPLQAVTFQLGSTR